MQNIMKNCTSDEEVLLIVNNLDLELHENT